MAEAFSRASERRRIGLRVLASLATNEPILDSAVAGFRARRQLRKSIAYVVLALAEV